jgi:alpha-tubulin suppressor-like RCC1 family protein
MGQGALNASAGAKPVRIGTSNQWVSVALGAGEHVLAMQANGSLWAWGENSEGQLGDGTKQDKYTPIQIISTIH